tara:strand:- start:75 stop:830 length:756 start_codon:yes stop_codon:yes gene_type:complete
MDNYRFDKKNYEFNPKSKKGVYIVHGFSSTTFEVKELAEFLGKEGYHTIAKNLPGHGLTAEDCNRMKYNDWFYHIKEDLAKLSSESEKLYIIGGSMGAVLSLYASSIFPLNGCIVGGTVLKFKNPFTVNIINRFLCRFVKIREKKKQASRELRNSIKFYGYKQYPLLALNEFRKMNKIVIKNLSKIKCPTLIIHSNNDRLSLKNNVDLVYNNISSQKKEKIYVENAHHNLFDENPDQKKIFNNILKFLHEN